jgi:hypothetical protein
MVGVVVWVRPLGRVQRMVPGCGWSTFQSGACLTLWWRRHYVDLPVMPTPGFPALVAGAVVLSGAA